jgi:hypothetical protein
LNIQPWTVPVPWSAAATPKGPNSNREKFMKRFAEAPELLSGKGEAGRKGLAAD